MCGKAVEAHEHTEGDCNLPAISKNWWGRNRCHYEFQYTGTMTCCCGMCHGIEFPDRTERQRRRPERRQRRLGDRDWHKDYD